MQRKTHTANQGLQEFQMSKLKRDQTLKEAIPKTGVQPEASGKALPVYRQK